MVRWLIVGILLGVVVLALLPRLFSYRPLPSPDDEQLLTASAAPVADSKSAVSIASSPPPIMEVLDKESVSPAQPVLSRVPVNRSVSDQFWIRVDKSDLRAYVMDGDSVVFDYPIASGRDSDPTGDDFTPVGDFEVIRIAHQKEWNPSPRIREECRLADPTFPMSGPIAGGDHRNALGEYWIGINVPAIGLHGNNDQTRIGKRVTHGCVSFYNDEIAVLARIAQNGRKVSIQE